MSARGAAFVRWWPVGSRTCTATVSRPRAGQPVRMVIEWSPAVPGALNAAELIQYRAGRDAALADLARELGITATLLED